jgi:two-component system, NarL family, sensor histidine kinase UhpB
MADSLTRPELGVENRRWAWVRPAWWSLSLYVRVVVVNSAVLLLAVFALVVTPATVSFPISTEQGLVLVVGAVVIALADAVLLRLNFRGLRAVVRRMETIDVLRPEELLPETGGPEAKSLIVGFNTMLERLETERRTSARRTLTAIEGERRRIGRELHDEIGQRLTGTLLELQRLADDLPEPFKSEVACVQEQQRATLDEVGALAWQLRPALLDDLGLLSAVDALAESLNEPGVRIETSLPESLPALPPELELVVYRIAQEALTNAVRHARASRIGLELEVRTGRLTLQVRDDGTGFSIPTSEGPGIRGMRERALLVGGRLHIGPAGDVRRTGRRGSAVRLDVTNVAAATPR